MSETQVEHSAATLCSAFDAQIGRLSRAIEEAGFHWWTIYPREMALDGVRTHGIHAELVLDVDSGKCIRYGLDWYTGMSVDWFISQLEFADWCMREKAEEDGVHVLPSPRGIARREWSTVGTLVAPQVCVSDDNVGKSAVE